ncbi:hypothetical protein [Corynebacterium aquatimens]|uniref:Uncharacterized protein n=1 Tax=Corynebacterium aquatimens TaxID=1190508 RepID=A0A931DYG8_9CORY|nr:hypothetical protein [Corynebacterium aquatimens]MBG6122687.1 hypothetical protein [Corynebacterium aquatimens]
MLHPKHKARSIPIIDGFGPSLVLLIPPNSVISTEPSSNPDDADTFAYALAGSYVKLQVKNMRID